MVNIADGGRRRAVTWEISGYDSGVTHRRRSRERKPRRVGQSLSHRWRVEQRGMIQYANSPAGVSTDMLAGFFVGWPNPPEPQAHLRLLHRSDAVELALDDETRRVVGYATGLTDGVLTLYVAQLEVLPDYRGRGIGTELIRRLLGRFGNLYAIDVICDPDVQPFYERLGMERATGMLIRRPERQSGAH
jgi:GNAT superfamily N-acetyltransferase